MHRAFSMVPDHIEVGHRPTLQILIILLFFCATARAESKDADVPTVGIEGAISVVLPAAGLQAAPLADKPRLIVRIAAATPTEDGRTHYDVRYIGLAPGRYDLSDYLVAPPGETSAALPAIPVTINSILPENHEGSLVSSELEQISLPGGYTVFFIAVWACWAILLIPLIFLGRARKPPVTQEKPPYTPTLADLLRPLVHKAMEGQMTLTDKTRLERLLMNYWCTRMNLDRSEMITTVEQLKQHPQAGALLRQMEYWLHEPPGRHHVDLAEVLTPYQNIPADEAALQQERPS